jgi:transposase InsO family protein
MEECFRVLWELLSDKGHNFESRLIQEGLQCLGVSKTRTTPPHPQPDGMVERHINEIKKYLQIVVTLHQSTHLSHGLQDRMRVPIFLLAYRESPHDTTGLTSASLMFRRELQLPCNLFGTPLTRKNPKWITW